MNITKKLMYVFFLLVLTTAVSAAVDVNFNANINDFQIAFYDCLDAGCNTVDTFSGALIEGTSTNDGSIKVRFPDSLATPFGYAGHFVSDGYLPKAGIFTWHTNGIGGVATTSFSFDFEKINSCSATVDSFTLTNNVFANIPLVIQTDARVDAETASAMELTGITGFIPPEFIDEYYSIDTRVTLVIKDVNGDVVATQIQEFTAANNNAIFASSSQPVEFIWTPIIEGPYEAEIITEVIDDQCDSTSPVSSGKESFEVLSEPPRDMCYTVLNNLEVNNPNPSLGEELNISFTKITNLAPDVTFGDPAYFLMPLQTAITYRITQGNNIIESDVFTLPANPDNSIPTTHSFAFTLPQEGDYEITVIGNAPICIAPTNLQDIIDLNINVGPIELYDIEFQVVNENGNPLSGANITINGMTLTTDNAGIATIFGLQPGTYTYTAVSNGFTLQTNIVTITNHGRVVFITMTISNIPPAISVIPDVIVPKNLNGLKRNPGDDFVVIGDNMRYKSHNTVGQSLRFRNFDEGSDVEVAYSGNPGEFANAALIVKGELVTVLLGNNDEIVVDINQIGYPVIDLNQYVDDPNHADFELTWTATQTSNVQVFINVNNHAFIMPKYDFEGMETITFTVTDPAGESDSQDITVTITAGNEPPVLNQIPDVVTDEDINFFQALNLNDFAEDPDTPKDNLRYTIVGGTDPNLGISIDANDFINLQPAPNFFGEGEVTIEVSDGINIAQNTFKVVVNPVPDAPIIQNFHQSIETNLTTPLLFNLSWYEADVDSAVLTWTAVAQDINVVDIVLDGKLMTITPKTLGSTQIDLTLTDETSLSDTVSFLFEVKSVVIPPQCNDGLDNDFDGLIDLADPGCANIIDNDETDAPALPACSDNLDNDFDGLVDLADPGCTDGNDDDESGPFPQQEKTHLKMQSIRLPNAYDLLPGDFLQARLRVENDGTESLDNVKVVLTIPELGIRSVRGPIDVPRGGVFDKIVLLNIPEDVEPGYYPLRITIGNGEELRVRYREIFISGDPVEEVHVSYCPDDNKWC